MISTNKKIFECKKVEEKESKLEKFRVKPQIKDGKTYIRINKMRMKSHFFVCGLQNNGLVDFYGIFSLFSKFFSCYNEKFHQNVYMLDFT